MKTALVLFGGFILFVASARADTQLVLEPLVSYGAGSYTESVSNVSGSGSYYGPVFGARPALEMDGFLFGAEILGAVSTLSPNTGSSTNTPGTIVAGLTAGYTLPMLPIRLIAGVDVLNYLWWYALDSSLNTQKYTTSGLGFRIGAGYSVMSFLRLNAEFVTAGLSVSSVDPALSGASIRTNQFQIGLSAPLSF